MTERKTFNNPVLNKDVADPTIWTDGEFYYLYYTNWWGTAPIYKSKDLIHWENTKKQAFTSETIEQLYKLCDTYQSDRCFYAPTVIRYHNNDLYLMYISISWKCMVVLSSSNPCGPFHFANDNPYVLIDNNITGLNITNEDSCIAFDGNNLYLMWGSHGNLYKTELTGVGQHLKRFNIPDSWLYNLAKRMRWEWLMKQAEKCCKKFKSEYKFTHIAGNPDDQYKVYEGLYAYKHNDYWYLFAASGQYNSTERPYKVVVGRAKDFDSVFVDKQGRKMTDGYAETILEPDSMEKYLGGGHTGEIYEDNDGHTFIFYQRQEANSSKRLLFLQ